MRLFKNINKGYEKISLVIAILLLLYPSAVLLVLGPGPYFIFSLMIGIFFLLTYQYSIRKLKKWGIYTGYTVVGIGIYVACTELGFDTGFYLYLLAAPPLAKYYRYLAEGVGKKSIKPWVILTCASLLLIASYDTERLLTSTNYVDLMSNRQMVKTLSAGTRYALYRLNAIGALSIIFYTVTKFYETAKHFEHIAIDSATIDSLTGLRDRRNFLSHIEEQYGNDIKNSAAAIIDIDFFKQFNDKYGHKIGDEVLKYIARRLSSIEDKNTLCCRWGGEEFVVFSIGPGAEDDIRDKLIGILDDLLTNPPVINKQELDISFTGGVTPYHEGDTIDTLINRADTYLYEGKKEGRRRIKILG
jgi:diguanylate cyclase (GGDEF)-like protein